MIDPVDELAEIVMTRFAVETVAIGLRPRYDLS